MKALLPLSILLITDCDFSQNEPHLGETLKSLEWVDEADPVADSQNAIEREDFRFKGVYGYSLYVPGVPNDCILGSEGRNKIVAPIEGTSDAIPSYEYARLQAIATEYAEWYNMQILIYLIENEAWQCNL